MDEPLISIILPVFNGEDYLNLAISSCLDQTYRNVEVVVVDDCSTDKSFEIAKGFQAVDSRIRIISNSQNKKLPASLNIGHENAKGEYLTWTSHDNIYHPEAIENLYRELVKNNTDVVYSSYLIIDEKGRLRDARKLKDIEYSFFYGVIGACFLYSKKFYIKNEKYDEDLFLLEDFDFWLRGLKHGNFYKIENPGFYFYRYHEDGLTSKINNDLSVKNEFQEKLFNCYKKIFDIKTLENSNQEFLEYFSNQRVGDNESRLIPLRNGAFFTKLKGKIKAYKGISYVKLKRIIVQDCIELILKNREYQKISLLLNLHLIAGPELLRLPIERYLALCKKCLL